MAYVPQHVVSGDFVFHQIEPAVVSTMRAKERNGVETSVTEYFSLRSGVLNSPTMESPSPGGRTTRSWPR